MGLLMKRTPFPRILRFDSVRIVFLQVLCERNLKTEVSKSFEALSVLISLYFFTIIWRHNREITVVYRLLIGPNQKNPGYFFQEKYQKIHFMKNFGGVLSRLILCSRGGV